MKSQNTLYILVALVLLFSSCKKEEPTVDPAPVNNDVVKNVAPCSPENFEHISDTLGASENAKLPNTTYRVGFYGSQFSGIFGFKEIPTTGYYSLTDPNNMNNSVAKQVSYLGTGGTYDITSCDDTEHTIYVENNETEFIISFCGARFKAMSPNPDCTISTTRQYRIAK